MALQAEDLATVQQAANDAANAAIERATGQIVPCLLSAATATIPEFLKSFIACITGTGTCKPKQ